MWGLDGLPLVVIARPVSGWGDRSEAHEYVVGKPVKARRLHETLGSAVRGTHAGPIRPGIPLRIAPFARALQARRYDEDPGRNAFNRYVGVEFIERVATNRLWEVDLRYEVNETESPRQHYVRWTFGTGYSFVVARADRAEVEVRYRMQRYPFRLVDVDDLDVQRRDHREIPRITWTHPLRSNLDLRAGYTRETRSSNDPAREFTAHLVTLTLLRRW